MEYSRTKNSALSLLTGVGGQALHILMRFVCRTVFIKTLGISYLGIDGLFADILSLLSLAEFGLDTAITYRLYKPVTNDDLPSIRTYLSFFKLAYRVIGLIVIIIGLLCIPLLKYIIADYDSLESLGINAVLIFLLYLAQSVSSYLFFAYRSVVLKVYQKLYILDGIVFTLKILSCFVQIVILLITKDFILFVLSLTLFGIIQNLVTGYVATKLYPHCFYGKQNKISFLEVRSLLKDCGALFFFKMNSIVLRATDNIVLSAFLGLVIVGLYSNYLMIYMGFLVFLGKMQQSFSASMGNLYASEALTTKYFFFKVMNFFSVIIYGSASVCIAVVGDEFIEWWVGYNLVLAKPFSILLGLQLFLSGLKLNLAQTREISGVFSQMWFRPLWGSIVNIVASVLFVKYWGASGVLLGTLLASVFANLAIDPVVIHKYTFQSTIPVKNYYYRNGLFIIATIAIGFFCLWVCSNIVLSHQLFSLITHSVICFCITCIGLIFLFWNRSECSYIRNKTISLICAKS